MLTLHGPTDNQIAPLAVDSLLVVYNASWDLYWKLANEDLKIDFIEEKIYIHSPASLTHEKIFQFLLLKIRAFIRAHELGLVIGSRFPILLKDKKRCEPDLVFLSQKAIENGVLSETIFEGEPTWIIEIVSPAYRDHDTITKRKQYSQINVGEYWIVDYEFKTVEIVNFSKGKEIRKEIIEEGTIKPRLEGFEEFFLSIEELFSSNP